MDEIRVGVKDKDVLKSDSNVKILTTENKLQTMRSFFATTLQNCTQSGCPPCKKESFNDMRTEEVHNLGMQSNTTTDTMETGGESLSQDGTAFNYPFDHSLWLSKTISAVFIVFMVVFRAQRIMLRTISRIPRQILTRIPDVTSFKNLCPVLNNMYNLVSLAGGSIDAPKYEVSKTTIFEPENGTEVLRMRKDIAIAKKIRIYTVSLPESEATVDIKRLCRSYPKVASITRRSILGALELAKTIEFKKENVNQRVEGILMDFCYLVGFLSFNHKTMCPAGPPILSDVVAALAILCSCGLSEVIGDSMSIIQERLSKDNTGILGTLPSARLSYVREVFLGSRKIYYHQKALPSNSTSGWVTQNLIHLFKNTSDFNNTLYSVNCFLFVRSNLEVRKFCKDSFIEKHCIKVGNFIFVKNRITCNGDIPAELLMAMNGLKISQEQTVLHRDSPILHWVFNDCHRKAIGISRPNNRSAEHLGLPTTSLSIQRGFTILGGRKIVRDLIERCIMCKFRRQSFKSTHLAQFNSLCLDHFKIPAGVWQIDLIPVVKISPTLGVNTRQSKVLIVSLIVAVDRLSRFCMVQVIRSRKVPDIILGLETLFLRHGMPKFLSCDQESAITAIARKDDWPMTASGFVFNFDSGLACLFVPATPSGHSRAGLPERMIKNLKLALGGPNFDKSKIDLIALEQILEQVTNRLNSLPIACKQIGGESTDTHGFASLVSPELVFKGLRMTPVGYPSMGNGTLDYKIRENLIIAQDILRQFSIVHYSNARTEHKKQTKIDNFQTGDVIAFFKGGKGSVFQPCWEGFKLGIVEYLTDFEGGVPRSAIIKFVTLVGSPSILSKKKIILSKRKLSDLILILPYTSMGMDEIVKQEALIMKDFDKKEDTLAFINNTTTKIERAFSLTKFVQFEQEGEDVLEEVYVRDQSGHRPDIGVPTVYNGPIGDPNHAPDREVSTQGNIGGISHGSSKNPKTSYIHGLLILGLCIAGQTSTTYQTEQSQSKQEYGMARLGGMDTDSSYMRALVCDGGREKLIDLVNIPGCNRTQFSLHQPGQPISVSLLHYPDLVDIETVVCTVRIVIQSVKCINPRNIDRIVGVGQYTTNFEKESDQYFLIKDTACNTLYTEGELHIKLGRDNLSFYNLTLGEDHRQVFLHDSDIDTNSGYERCKAASGLVYQNASHQFIQSGGKVIRADIRINIAKEIAEFSMREQIILTKQLEKIEFPSLTGKIKFQPFFPAYRDNKSTVLFYFNFDPLKTCVHYMGNTKGTLYKAVNITSPEMLELKIIQPGGVDILTVALQLGSRFTNCGMDSGIICQHTQFQDILACSGDGSLTELKRSPLSMYSHFKSKDSGAINFLQNNIDHSISGILFTLCLENRRKMRKIALDFEMTGGLLDQDSIGVYSFRAVSLGEVGSLTTCSQKYLRVVPMVKENVIYCCKDMPVLLNGKVMYLAALKRTLSEQCNIIHCGSSIYFIDTQGRSVKQSKGGIVIKNKNLEVLDPTQGLKIFNLSPLSVNETRGEKKKEQSLTKEYRRQRVSWNT